MLKKRRAQGIVESVFAIGILAILLGGSVILIVLGMNNRRNSFDRRTASELATIVTEELIAASRSDPVSFWKLTPIGTTTRSGFPNYTYSVGFTNITNNATYPNCGVGKTDCAEVGVKVTWQDKTSQTMTFNRFFSRYE